MAVIKQGLYLVTPDFSESQEAEIFAQVTDALDAGIALLQYRNKSTDADLRLRQAKKLLSLCQQYHTPFLINDDYILAHTIGADGVHLGQQDGSLIAVRRLLGKNVIIGSTCHASLTLAHTAMQNGANYVSFGRFFSSHSKPHAPPAPLHLLTQAKQEISVPIVAIGGISLENATQVIAAGADLLAVIHGFFSENKREQLLQLVSSAINKLASKERNI